MQEKREKKILKILLENSPNIYTSKSLSSLVNVSSRTIKTDLEKIKDKLGNIGVQLKAERGKGYWIEESGKEKINELLDHDMLESFPFSVEDSQIIEILLFRNVFLPVHEIAEKLYVSDSTLLRKIAEINKKIRIYDLKIIKEHGKGIKLIGEEKNHRLLFSSLLKKYNVSKDINYQNLYTGNVLKKEEINNIHSALMEFQRKHEIGLSDIAKTGLIIDIAITLSRIKTNQNLIISTKELDELKLNKEWYYALDLVNILSKSFDINISESEIGFISIHLLSANLLNKELPNNFDEIRSLIDENLLDSILNWIKKIDSQFNTELHDDVKFIGSIALHIEPMIKRIEYGISLPNPWVEEFKNKYKKAYEMSVQLSYEIQKTVKRSITENEITYLAMHVGGALERFKEKEKIDVILVCFSGIGTSNFLKARLKRKYPEFNIKKILTSSSKELNTVKDQLVISTVPIEQDIDNYILISPLLNDNDQNIIQNHLEKNQVNNVHKKINKKLFLNNVSAKNKEEILKISSELLMKNGYVGEQFFKKLLERENLSSTEVGNMIAIPHSFSNNSMKKSGISVLILDEPIIWDKTPVQIVFVIVIDTNDTVDITKYIERISEFSDDLDRVEKSLDSSNFEEFLNIFMKYN